MFASTSKPKILIVEDDELLAIFIQLKLELMGYIAVGKTANGQEAIELTEKLAPDLILMDIHLTPEMDGIQAASIIRAQFSLPVIFLSEAETEETLNRAAHSSAYGFISKPFSDQELRTTIEMALYKHRTESRLQVSDLALKSISQAVIISGPDRNIIMVNEAFTEQTGYEKHEVLGRSCNFLQGPGSSLETINEIRECLNNASIFNGEILNYRKDGSDYWNELTITPAFNEKQHLTHFVAVCKDITERKITMTALRQSERDLLEAERSSHVGHWFWDALTHKLTWSDEMIRIWRRSPDEFNHDIREMIKNTVHPDDQVLVLDSCKEAFEDKEEYEPFEYRIFLPDASIRVIWAKTGYKLKDENGRILRITGAVQDITVRKKMEEERRLNDARMERSFGGSPIGMALIDIDGRLLRVNHALCNMLKLTENDLLFTDWQLLSHPDDLYLDEEKIKLLLAGSISSYQINKRFVHHNHQEVWVQLNVSLVRDVQNNPVNFVAQIQDITERLKSEAQLLQLSQAVEQSVEAIVITDLHGDIDYVNDAFTKKYGYTKEEVKGKNPRLLKSDLNTPTTFVDLWQTISIGETWKGELFNRGKDGSVTEEYTTITPLRQPDGRISHFVSSQEDVTEKKKLTAEIVKHRDHLEDLVASRTLELAQARQLAEAANRAKSNFIANMSHEIRTPMNGVMGMTYLALASTSDPKQRDYLKKIQLSSQHLLHIVDDILDFSKIEAGKINIDNIDFLVDDLVQKLSAIVSTKAFNKHLQFNIEIDPELPRKLHGDSHRICQVLINLTNNAIKFTEKGHVHVRIQKESQTSSGFYIKFEVEDTGIGLSEQQQTKIFQSFEQADTSTTRKYGGTGLGLTISKQLVELMGGEIGVKSRLGFGCTMWFSTLLEFAKTDQYESLESKISENPGQKLKRHNLSLRPIRILLVDDNEFNQQVGSELLESVKCKVSTVSNGQQAIDFLSQEEVDCVLMDIQMPIMDGMEATRLLRLQEKFQKLPIIAMTANALVEDRMQCLSIGLNDFIAKPFSPEILFATVLRWITNPETALQDSLEINLTKNETASVSASMDFTSLANLVGNSPEKIAKFALKFLDSASKGLQEFAAASQDNNLNLMCDLGHKFKSSARTVGANHFADLCHEIENLRATGTAQQAAKIASLLPNELIVIKQAIHTYLHPENDLPSPSNKDSLQNKSFESNLHILVVEDDSIDMEVNTTILRNIGLHHISCASEANQALAIMRAYQPDVILCDLNLHGIDGITFLRTVAEMGFQGHIILLSAVDRSVLKASENLVRNYGMEFLASLAKPLDATALVNALTEITPSKNIPLAYQNQPQLTIDDLKKGLVENAIELWFQPKISLETERVVGVECLARWRHSEQCLLNPFNFVSLIEKHGLIDQFSKIILDKSAQQLRKWNSLGHPLKMAINLSMDNFHRVDLPEEFEAIVKAYGIRPSQIILEITETRLMENLNLSLEILTRLRLKGFGLSIDDFGTGFTTMENLKKLPLTELKIDRAFVNGAHNDEAARAILNSSIQLGKIFQLNIVAEGVETEQDWNYLLETGCDEVQGFFIASPMSAEHFLDWKLAWSKEHRIIHTIE
jgi:PAS domain S-box-containing protein